MRRSRDNNAVAISVSTAPRAPLPLGCHPKIYPVGRVATDGRYTSIAQDPRAAGLGIYQGGFRLGRIQGKVHIPSPSLPFRSVPFPSVLR
jgi:hypothetical protein